MSNVFAMPHKRHFDATEVKTFLSDQGKEYANELEIALSKMQDAKNLGAVMKLSLSDGSPRVHHGPPEGARRVWTLRRGDHPGHDAVHDEFDHDTAVHGGGCPTWGQKNMSRLKSYVRNAPSGSVAVFMKSLAITQNAGR